MFTRTTERFLAKPNKSHLHYQHTFRAAPARASATRPSKSSQSRKDDDALPVSLFFPQAELPPDGRSMFAEDEVCDTEVKSCKTPVHTWEQDCIVCNGEGNVISYVNKGRKKHRVVGTCLMCSGVGVIRKSSARIAPTFDSEYGHLTVARKPDDLAKRAALEKRAAEEKRKLISGGSD